MELTGILALIVTVAGVSFVFLSRANAKLAEENKKLAEELHRQKAHFESLVDRITISTGPRPTKTLELDREEWSVDFANMLADFGKYAELFGRFSYATRYRIRQNEDATWEMKALEDGADWEPVPDKLVPALELGRALHAQVRSLRELDG